MPAQRAPSSRPSKTGARARSNRSAIEPARREELIRAAAHVLFERRGGEHGHDLEDWLAAEHQVDESIARGTALPV